MNTILPYLKTHVMYVVIIAGMLLAGHAWLQEHDARLQADQQVKLSESTIKTLQQQAAQKVQVITKIVHDVKTPDQAVTAIPQLTDAPLNTRVAVDNPAQVSVDAVPLVTVLGQAKIDKTNLEACQSTLIEKDKVIKASKPTFWGKVKGQIIPVAVGIIIRSVL